MTPLRSPWGLLWAGGCGDPRLPALGSQWGAGALPGQLPLPAPRPVPPRWADWGSCWRGSRLPSDSGLLCNVGRHTPPQALCFPADARACVPVSQGVLCVLCDTASPSGHGLIPADPAVSPLRGAEPGLPSPRPEPGRNVPGRGSLIPGPPPLSRSPGSLGTPRWGTLPEGRGPSRPQLPVS